MQGRCGLTSDINKCPHYQVVSSGCGIDHTVCCFYIDPGEKKEEKTEYKRKTRWYEPYYKR